MSTIKVESTTDTKENLAALNAPAEKTAEKVEDKPAAAAQHAETNDASGASEESEEIQDDENEESDDAKEGDESKDGDEKVEDGKPKKKNGFKKRIDKLNKRASNLEQEAKYWREQALKGQNPPAKVDEKKETAKSAEGKPNVDDYKTHTEYVEALTDWKIEKNQKEAEAKKSLEKDKSVTDGLFKNYGDQIAELKKTVDDFDAVLEDVHHVNVPKFINTLILKSENGAELTYALAKNPKEFERICALPREDAARAMGRFEAKLNYQTVEKKTTETTKTTSAPAPIRPVGSGGTSAKAKSIYDKDLSQSEYEEMREKQRRAKRGA